MGGRFTPCDPASVAAPYAEVLRLTGDPGALAAPKSSVDDEASP
ncbi:hypothetical protein VZQ01_38980 [Myxococcus faecalis]